MKYMELEFWNHKYKLITIKMFQYDKSSYYDI